MQSIANHDDYTDKAPTVIMDKIIRALMELGAFSPETSVHIIKLCQEADVSSCEMSRFGHRIASDEFVVMPRDQRGGFFAGVYLCLDPSVIEKASHDLKRQAVRSESQAGFYRGAAERMRRHTAACAEQDDGVQDAQGT